jgi:hypothetical protein
MRAPAVDATSRVQSLPVVRRPMSTSLNSVTFRKTVIVVVGDCRNIDEGWSKIDTRRMFLGVVVIFFSLLTRQPPAGQGLLIHEVSGSHTTTHLSR